MTGVALAAGGVAAWRFSVAQDEFDERRSDGTTDFTELRALWGGALEDADAETAGSLLAEIEQALEG